MSSFNHCFFSCMHVSRRAGKMVWYSHHFDMLSRFFIAFLPWRKEEGFLMKAFWSLGSTPSPPSPASLCLCMQQWCREGAERCAPGSTGPWDYVSLLLDFAAAVTGHTNIDLHQHSPDGRRKIFQLFSHNLYYFLKQFYLDIIHNLPFKTYYSVFLIFYYWKWKSLSHVWLFAILQARIREWVALPFSRGSSPPRDRT